MSKEIHYRPGGRGDMTGKAVFTSSTIIREPPLGIGQIILVKSHLSNGQALARVLRKVGFQA